MKSRTMLFAAMALGALALALLSLGEVRPAKAAGFTMDPRCAKPGFRDPVRGPIICSCYLQNGGWIGYRYGQALVFGPPNPQLIDVINNCIMSAKPDSH
jgi:hypothetical protein